MIFNNICAIIKIAIYLIYFINKNVSNAQKSLSNEYPQDSKISQCKNKIFILKKFQKIIQKIEFRKVFIMNV